MHPNELAKLSNFQLIDHLHSDDFFDVKNHPKATFTLKNLSPLNNSSP